MSKFFAANWHLTVWLRVETLIRNLQVSRRLDLQTALRQLNSKFPPKSCNRYLTLSLTRVNFAESGASIPLGLYKKRLPGRHRHSGSLKIKLNNLAQPIAESLSVAQDDFQIRTLSHLFKDLQFTKSHQCWIGLQQFGGISLAANRAVSSRRKPDWLPRTYALIGSPKKEIPNPASVAEALSIHVVWMPYDHVASPFCRQRMVSIRRCPTVRP